MWEFEEIGVVNIIASVETALPVDAFGSKSIVMFFGVCVVAMSGTVCPGEETFMIPVLSSTSAEMVSSGIVSAGIVSAMVVSADVVSFSGVIGIVEASGIVVARLAGYDGSTVLTASL